MLSAVKTGDHSRRVLACQSGDRRSNELAPGAGAALVDERRVT